VLEARDAPFVHLTLSLRRGTGAERTREFGYLALLGTLLGRGCGAQGRSEFAFECDRRGANIGVYPGRDFLTLEAWVLPQDLPWALQTLATMVWRPRLEASEIELAVEEHLEQLLARLDEKRAQLFDTTRASLFRDGHPYQRALLGREHDLRAVDPEAVRTFHQRLLEQVSVVLCITGDVRAERLPSLIEGSGFGPTGEISGQGVTPAPFKPLHRTSVAVDFPVEQAEVLLALPALPRGHREYPLISFCNEILGGAFLSRLTRAVRIHGGLAYSADSRYQAGLEAGVIWVALQTDRQKVSRALGLVRKVMEELVERPLNAEEYEHFRDFVRGSLQFEYDALSSLTSRRLEKYLYGDEWQLESRLQQFDSQVSPESAHRCFQELLKPEQTLVCVLGQGVKANGAFHQSTRTPQKPTPGLSLVSGTSGQKGSGVGVRELHSHGESGLFCLDNGLRVLVLPRQDIASLSVQVWTLTGSMDEARGKTGLSHLLEHLMFRGSARFPDGSFDAVLAQTGGINNAYTTEDFTVYTDYLTPEGLDDALMLEADRWRHLQIAPELFKVELGVVLEERSVRVDCNPLGKAYELLQHLALGKEPYGHPVIGWRQDLLSLQRQDLVDHYQRARECSRILLVVAGGCNANGALCCVQRWFGDFPASTKASAWPVLANQSHVPPLQGRYKELSERSGYSYLLLCYRFPRQGHHDFEACELLTRIIGEGDSSLLHEEFVKGRRWFLELWTNYEPQSRDNPLLFVSFASAQTFDGDFYRRGVTAFLEAIDQGLTLAELEKARRSWLAEEAFGTDELEDWALEIAGRVLLMPWSEVWKSQERVEAVTVDDLRRVARQYLRAEHSVAVSLQGTSE
jgi:zinc protease